MLTKRILSLQTISRSITPYLGATRHQLHTTIKLSASSSESSDSSGSDSDNESIKSKLKKDLAEDLKRRDHKNVLSGLINDLSTKTASSKIDVAIPKKAPRRPIKNEPAVTEESQFEMKLTSAAKDVAEKIGGDVKKTELDLLDRLMRKDIKSVVDEKSDAVASSEPTSNLRDILMECKIDRSEVNTHEVDIQKERINRIRTTTRKVDNFQVQANREGSILHDLLQQKKRADVLKEDSKPTEKKGFSENERQAFTSRFRELKQEQMSSETSQKEFKPPGDKSFGISERSLESDSTMWKLYREKKESRTRQKEFETSQDDSSDISERPRPSDSILWNLYREKRGDKRPSSNFAKYESFKFHNKSYGIFKDEQTSEPKVAELSTWAELEKKELKFLLYHPPQNYFQEMIQWTEKGKVWRFPIDNEQGMEEEQSIHFSEHVFMERHLKGWCPKKGPIRHFMELVCVGLSKNPYMTVEEKVQHIMWYKDYFGDKRELLTELGAIQNEDSAILPKPTNKIDLGPHV